eukprot:9870719-Karenia_brevis.AAC.1
MFSTAEEVLQVYQDGIPMVVSYRDHFDPVTGIIHVTESHRGHPCQHHIITSIIAGGGGAAVR